MGWVLGVAIIAFILLIMAIIFGNLSGNLGFDKETTTDISGNTTTTVNITGTYFGNRTLPDASCVVDSAYYANATGSFYIAPGNYSVDSAICQITANAGLPAQYNNSVWAINSTTTYDSQAEQDTDNVITNYTKSTTNITNQFPTVGTIIGVSILLTILIGLLVFAITKMMGVSGAAGGSMGTTSSSRFEGSSRGFS